MAKEIVILDRTQVADVDLSSSQYCFVKLTSTGVALCTAITDIPYGILQNNPIQGQNATVRVAGMSKLKMGGTVTKGQTISTSATSLGIVAATTSYQIGFCEVGANNGEIGSIMIQYIGIK